MRSLANMTLAFNIVYLLLYNTLLLVLNVTCYFNTSFFTVCDVGICMKSDVHVLTSHVSLCMCCEVLNTCSACRACSSVENVSQVMSVRSFWNKAITVTR